MDRYYNIGKSEKYFIQIQSQAKSSGIKLPEVHPNIQPEKQVIKPLVSKVKEISHIKPRIGLGRAGIRQKKPDISQPIAQSVKLPQKIPEVPKIQEKVINIPNFTTPVQSISNPITEVINR